MNFPEPTYEESILNAYSDCHKSDWGVRPSLSGVTAEDAARWLDDRQARIDANVAAGRPLFDGIGYPDEPKDDMERDHRDQMDEAAELDAAELAALYPAHHFIPAALADGW